MGTQGSGFYRTVTTCAGPARARDKKRAAGVPPHSRHTGVRRERSGELGEVCTWLT